MRYVYGVVGVIAFLLLGVAIWLWDPLTSDFNPDEAVAAASAYNVEIVRDEWGVPHIYGKTDADAVFGVAYAHAEDDFETIQEVTAAARGDLARYLGAEAAATDYLVSFFSVWETIDQRYEQDVPADVKAAAEAYAKALNLYAAQNPRKTWPGLAPFKAQDIVAFFTFTGPFFYNLDRTLLSLLSEERNMALSLSPDDAKSAWLVKPATFIERGSNAFAVSPLRSDDNITRLVINSHQPMTGPVAWYEAHMVSEDGLDITGGLFPGTPFILHGFNRDLGWANTVSAQDLVDVYRLTINPDNDSQYRLDGEWVEFDESMARIGVRLFGPFTYTAKRPLKVSKHGPVIEASHGTYAVRYAGHGEIRQLEHYYRLNRATNFDEFMDVMAMNAIPSINYVYADKSGNIALIHNAQYPDRIPGWEWKKDLPGDRSDLIWDGYLPYERVPMLINPTSGFVFEANNTPFTATDGPDNLKPSDFPDFMGLQTNETNRALRIVELTNGTEPMTRERLLSIKFDTSYAANSVARQVVEEVLDQDWQSDPKLAEAAEHLRAWDGMMDAGSRHAALAGLTTIKAVTEPLTGIPAPEPAQAFRDAVDHLYQHFGRIDPEWGELNRLVRGTFDSPLDGASDVLRAIYPAELGEDGRLVAAAGDTWIALVEWDEEGNQTAEVIHNFGSATLDQSSPHYADQAPLFVNQEWRKALLDQTEIRAQGKAYRPQD